MSKLSAPSRPSGKANFRIVWTDPLPSWEQLSPTRQHELVMILATMLSKQLSIQGQARKGRSDEHPT